MDYNFVFIDIEKDFLNPPIIFIAISTFNNNTNNSESQVTIITCDDDGKDEEVVDGGKKLDEFGSGVDNNPFMRQITFSQLLSRDKAKL